MARKRVAVLISGRGSNLAALIAAAQAPDYPAEIVFVLSNRPDAAGLAFAAQRGISAAVVDHKAFGKDRAAFDAAMQAELDARNIDILCLAGFMRLLTDDFVRRWHGRMINVHPALLPSFKGLDTHERALSTGVKIHGATVHFVVPEMDAGPIIAQAAVAVLDEDTADDLARRVLAVEHVIYPQALAWLAQGRTRIDGDRVSIDGVAVATAPLVVPSPELPRV